MEFASQFSHHFDPLNTNPNICSRCGRPPGDSQHDMGSYNDRLTEPRMGMFSHYFINRQGGHLCERCGQPESSPTHQYGSHDDTPSPLLVGVT